MVKIKEINFIHKIAEDYRSKVRDDEKRDDRTNKEIFRLINFALSRTQLPIKIERKVYLSIRFELDEQQRTREYNLVVRPERFPKPDQKPYVAIALDDY